MLVYNKNIAFKDEKVITLPQMTESENRVMTLFQWVYLLVYMTLDCRFVVCGKRGSFQCNSPTNNELC